ncbi:DUF1501 domain-containing protein [Mycolicibacterium iranicum]|uniref:DUF1501 domain-containing protein n=1 Tax=Mycolicibacterium iranicum TaxID=912594 RepID=A0A1X1WZ21_MYCIR|nr:DUF1501 domain-containing protein [Mycolicibacterium iranicum]ORV91738.1 hypothetical protein AWC12_03495 [Mycolicibacterium iranicum]
MAAVTRRTFLTSCAGVGVAGAFASAPVLTWVDALLAANDSPLPDNSGILVLITLYGGNDGLNTVIPYTDSAYYDARPELAYDAEKVLKLDGQYGLNPGMAGMASMFRDGSLAIVRGVGYPNPDHSHFRSMDIWQSGTVDSSVKTGWIGRWLDANGADPLQALHVGPTLPRLVIGEKCSAAAFSGEAMPSPATIDLMTALSEPFPGDSHAMSLVSDSYGVAIRAQEELTSLYGEDGNPRIAVDDGSLKSQLDVVAACIAADVPTRVYSVSLGGFDTHADERGTQKKLLMTLDEAVTRFMKTVAGGKRASDIVVMAYSEFGRRVPANSADGTDHGTAGPVFVFGDRVRGGFYGDDPILTELVKDDLKVTTDFRDVYHEVLVHGLRTDPGPVLPGGGNDMGLFRT